MLICMALRLQWPPFIWLFQSYYWLAVQFSRWRVSRVEGVRSIYLSGSLARRDFICGLSDIDFKVFVTGDKNPLIYDSIRRRFSRLRWLFPMLGSPDEKGIYFTELFESDYLHYPLVQHLFDERFFKHRLIWGEDILPALPIKPWQKLDQSECLFSRLRDWIEKVHLVADSDVLCRPQKQHLFFKAVCDTGLLAIRIPTPEFQFSRRADILLEILPEMEDPYRKLIENLILENQGLYHRALNSAEENFMLFKQMIAFCSAKAAFQDNSVPSRLGIEVETRCCAPGDSSIAETLQGFSPRIRKVSEIQWPQLPLNPFDLQLYNSSVYLVDCREYLDLKAFHELKVFYRNNLRDKAVVIIREDSGFLSSLDSDLLDHWGSFSGSSDLLHLFLGPLKRKTLSQIELKRVETRARSFLEQLAAVLLHSRFGRMDLSVFPDFLFNALRVIIFNHELGRGKWHWSVTPGETIDFLNGHTPLSPDFVRKLEKQYENHIKGGKPFDERFLPKCRALLMEMLEISLDGGAWQALEKLNSLADEQFLTISAAVITADRPAQLKRCLDSISGLSRLPDELVVVDSGRDPLTRSVVEQHQAGFPIHYFRHYRHGVARARNSAAQAANGEIIAFVDDDATVEPGWLEHLEREFLRDPRIGLASGSIMNMECGRNDIIWKFMRAVEKI